VGGLVTLAMVAGFALVVLTNHTAESGPDPVARNPQVKSVHSATILAATNSSVPPAVATITPFTVRPARVALGLGSVLNAEEVDNALPDRQALEWMQRVDQLPLYALVLDEQAFTQKAMVPPDTHVLHHPHSPQTSAEFTGFQLSR
jgi:hypothetical protein